MLDLLVNLLSQPYNKTYKTSQGLAVRKSSPDSWAMCFLWRQAFVSQGTRAIRARVSCLSHRTKPQLVYSKLIRRTATDQALGRNHADTPCGVLWSPSVKTPKGSWFSRTEEVAWRKMKGTSPAPESLRASKWKLPLTLEKL